MTGKELQERVNRSGIKIADLADKTGIKERTIYSLYEKEEVEEHYLEKLAEAGVKLQKTTLEDEVIYLRDRIIFHEKTIESLLEILKTKNP